TAAASKAGTATHVMTVAEMAAHQHDAFIRDPTHHHSFPIASTGVGYQGGSNPAVWTATAGSTNTTDVATGVHLNSINGGAAGTDDKAASTGSGAAHQTISPLLTGTWYWRL